MLVPTPRTAQILTSPSPVLWQNGQTFDGCLWLGLVLPPAASGNFPAPSLWASQRPQQLPQFTKIPIVGGLIDLITQVFWNSDIDPPGTQYVAYYFDRLNNLIAPASGTATPFTVNSAQFTITVPTLTNPSYVGVVNPVPQP